MPKDKKRAELLASVNTKLKTARLPTLRGSRPTPLREGQKVEEPEEETKDQPLVVAEPTPTKRKASKVCVLCLSAFVRNLSAFVRIYPHICPHLSACLFQVSDSPATTRPKMAKLVTPVLVLFIFFCL